MSELRFAATGKGGNFIRAGKNATKQFSNIFETATAYSPDYGGLAQRVLDAESSKRKTAIKAQADVVQTGISTLGRAEANKITADSDLAVAKQEIKTKMAGKLAAFGGKLAESLATKKEPPLPPATVDPQAYRDAWEQANVANGLNPDGSRISTDGDAPSTPQPQPSTPEGGTEVSANTATPAPQPTAAAPDDGGPMTFQKVYSMAVNANAQYPELIAAQWQLETGGTSGQGPTANNNIFAQKGGDFNSDTMEYVNGQYVSAPGEGWSSYESPQAATDWLVNNWYRDSDRHGKGAETLGGGSREGTARSLVSLGYATDPAYAEKLLRIARENGYG